jgi:hypothetical protein
MGLKEILSLLRRPLTKRLPGGMLNQRPSEIEAAFAQVLDLNRDQVIEALSILDRTHTKYIPPECLVWTFFAPLAGTTGKPISSISTRRTWTASTGRYPALSMQCRLSYHPAQNRTGKNPPRPPS